MKIKMDTLEDSLQCHDGSACLPGENIHDVTISPNPSSRLGLSRRSESHVVTQNCHAVPQISSSFHR